MTDAATDAADAEAAREALEGDVLDSAQAGGLVIRGGAWRAVGYVVGTLVSLLGIALITRHLGVTRYGQYQTVLSLITVVGATTDAGMATLGLREFAQYEGSQRDRLMATILGLRMALTALGTVIALGIGLVAGYDSALLLGIVLAGVGLAFTVAQTSLSIPLNAQLRIPAVTALDLTRQILTVAGFVVAVALGGGVVSFLAVPIPVGVVCVIACAWLVRGLIPFTPRFRVREWATLLRATAAFAAATATGTVYIFTSQILTSFAASPTEAGYFAASFRVIVVAGGIPGLLVATAFPILARAARDDRERLAYALQRLFDTSILLGAGIVLTLVCAAPTVIAVMAGPHFAPAAGVLQIQAFALFVTFLLAVWGFGLLALHRHRPLLLANLVALCVSAGLVVLLAGEHGAKGTAIATVVAESCLAAGYLIGLVRGHPDLRPRLDTAWRVAVAAALGGLTTLVALAPIPRTILAVAVFSAVVLALRAVPAEIWDGLRRRG